MGLSEENPHGRIDVLRGFLKGVNINTCKSPNTHHSFDPQTMLSPSCHINFYTSACTTAKTATAMEATFIKYVNKASNALEFFVVKYKQIFLDMSIDTLNKQFLNYHLLTTEYNRKHSQRQRKG